MSEFSPMFNVAALDSIAKRMPPMAAMVDESTKAVIVTPSVLIPGEPGGHLVARPTR